MFLHWNATTAICSHFDNRRNAHDVRNRQPRTVSTVHSPSIQGQDYRSNDCKMPTEHRFASCWRVTALRVANFWVMPEICVISSSWYHHVDTINLRDKYPSVRCIVVHDSTPYRWRLRTATLPFDLFEWYTVPYKMQLSISTHRTYLEHFTTPGYGSTQWRGPAAAQVSTQYTHPRATCMI